MLKGGRHSLTFVKTQLERGCVKHQLRAATSLVEVSPSCRLYNFDHRSALLRQSRGSFPLCGLAAQRLFAIPAPSRRDFSDRLLGYSPMAPPTPVASVRNDDPGSIRTKNIPTAEDVTVSGGVWAPTSAKRDKLAELKGALEEDQATLDDAATPEQLLDLFLADGILLIAKTTDDSAELFSFASSRDDPPKATVPHQIVQFESWLDELQKKQRSEELTELEMNNYLDKVIDRLSSLTGVLPPTRCLREVRDFYDAGQADDAEIGNVNQRSLFSVNNSFRDAVTRFRLQLVQSAADHLKESWKVLTTVSDADIDRAAVQGMTIEREATTVSSTKINAVLQAFFAGNCSDRVDATWALLDRDGDGLLDETEMNHVAFLTVSPVQKALVKLFQDALASSPVRYPLSTDLENDSQEGSAPTPLSWRQRRNEAKTSKKLLKMFQRACKYHFVNECEINHRLRCIYAWAEKSHQDNKIDSIMVDSGWSGRKRYVELSPKISLPEFREVQREHFTHLDRVGAEILKSFREDLWVMQGRGRQNRELMRDCLMFLATVSFVDYIILML